MIYFKSRTFKEAGPIESRWNSTVQSTKSKVQDEGIITTSYYIKASEISEKKSIHPVYTEVGP